MNICIATHSPANSLVNALKRIEENDPFFLTKIKVIFIDFVTESISLFADRYGIKVVVANISTNKKHTEYSNKLLKTFIADNIDYCILFSKYIIKPILLDKYPNRIINIHPALLPACKGLNAIDQSILHNSLLLGITAHFIDKTVDGGLPIIQYVISSSFYNSYSDILNKTAILLVQIIEWLEYGRIDVIENKVVVEKAIYKISSFIPNIDSMLAKHMFDQIKLFQE